MSKQVPNQLSYRAASETLVAEFPEFFDRAFDVTLPPGWLTLARGLFSALRVVAPKAKVAQLKEKFGGARCYLESGGNNEAFALIAEFESQSFRVCDACGAPGEPRASAGWMHTSCEKHQ